MKAEKSLDAVKRDMSDIVLPEQLQERVRALAAVTANTKQHGAPFRHMMFYGATQHFTRSVRGLIEILHDLGAGALICTSWAASETD